jgi:hypothetical protein
MLDRYRSLHASHKQAKASFSGWHRASVAAMQRRCWPLIVGSSFALLIACSDGDDGRRDAAAALDAGRDAAAADEPSGAGDLLAASASHACTLRQTGMYCWGLNFVGQLGNGSSQDSDVPVVADVERETVVELAVASGRTCVVRTEGDVLCWGANDFGQIGDGTRELAPHGSAPQGIDDATHIAVDSQSSCVVHGSAGEVTCSGESPADTPEQGSTVPETIEGLSNVVELHAGAYSAYCARDADDRVWYWKFSAGAWTEPKETAALAGARAIGLPAFNEVCGLLETGITCVSVDDDSTVELPDSADVSQMAAVGGALTVTARAPDGRWLLWNVPSFVLQAMGIADVAGAFAIEIGSDMPLRDLVVAGLRACALREDRSIVCQDLIDSMDDLDKRELDLDQEVSGFPR